MPKSKIFLYLTDSDAIAMVLYGTSCIIFIVMMVILYFCKITIIDSNPDERHDATMPRWVRWVLALLLLLCFIVTAFWVKSVTHCEESEERR